MGARDESQTGGAATERMRETIWILLRSGGFLGGVQLLRAADIACENRCLKRTTWYVYRALVFVIAVQKTACLLMGCVRSYVNVN